MQIILSPALNAPRPSSCLPGGMLETAESLRRAWKVRTGHGPENMATLRNFAINRLRAEGHANIAAGLREMSYEPFRARWTSPDQQQSKITRLGSSPGWLPPLRAWQ